MAKYKIAEKTIVSHYVKLLKNNYLLLLTISGTNSRLVVDTYTFRVMKYKY